MRAERAQSRCPRHASSSSHRANQQIGLGSGSGLVWGEWVKAGGGVRGGGWGGLRNGGFVVFFFKNKILLYIFRLL